jgi:hypothetical protein
MKNHVKRAVPLLVVGAAAFSALISTLTLAQPQSMNTRLQVSEAGPARAATPHPAQRPAEQPMVSTSDYVSAHLMTIGQYWSEEAAATPRGARRAVDG